MSPAEHLNNLRLITQIEREGCDQHLLGILESAGVGIARAIERIKSGRELFDLPDMSRAMLLVGRRHVAMKTLAILGPEPRP